jgi:hypothetical protein
VETRTAGAGGGPGKPTDGNVGRAPRADLTCCGSSGSAWPPVGTERSTWANTVHGLNDRSRIVVRTSHADGPAGALQVQAV